MTLITMKTKRWRMAALVMLAAVAFSVGLTGCPQQPGDQPPAEQEQPGGGY